MLNKNSKASETEFCSAIIVAAGKGSRMKSDINKQFMNLCDKPVLAHTLKAFENCELIDELILVVRQEDIMLCKEIISISDITKVNKIVVGGKERRDSVYIGLGEINKDASIVCIHDGARPLIFSDCIADSILAAKKFGCAVVGVKAKDTIKLVDNDNNVAKTLNRDKIWTVQTPQTFKVEILKNAYQKAIDENISATDDSMLVEKMGYSVKMVKGSYENIKITTPEDLLMAEIIINKRLEEEDL